MLHLAGTTGEVTTDALYWTNRIIAAIADPHFLSNSADLEHFREDILSYGHKLVAGADAAVKAEDNDSTPDMLEQANETMASHLRERTNALLAQVLFTSSNLMNNAFSLSDK